MYILLHELRVNQIVSNFFIFRNWRNGVYHVTGSIRVPCSCQISREVNKKFFVMNYYWGKLYSSIIEDSSLFRNGNLSDISCAQGVSPFLHSPYTRLVTVASFWWGNRRMVASPTAFEPLNAILAGPVCTELTFICGACRNKLVWLNTWL